MCQIVSDHAVIPQDPEIGESFDRDVCTFRIIFLKGKHAHKAYPITVGWEDGQVVMDVSFWKNQLLGIFTQITTIHGSAARFDDNLVDDLLGNIKAKVPNYETDPSIARQIAAFVREIPKLFDECQSMPAGDPCDQRELPVARRVSRLVDAAATERSGEKMY